MYGMGLIGGFCHLYIGQEAVVVGMKMAKRDGDQMITGYRDHGHMLACGMDPKGVMAELTGRRGGYSKGKGGSMHMFSREKNFYGGHGIVGAQVPLGTGLRLRQQISRERQRLPDLFRRRRRQPGPGLRKLQHGGAVEAAGRLRHREQPLRHGHAVTRSSAQTDFSKRGLSFNIPGVAGRRHGRARGKGGRRRGGRLVPRRQGSDHPRNDDLSLSRPFDVGPGEIPDQGRGRQGAHRARSDRAGARAAAWPRNGRARTN